MPLRDEVLEEDVLVEEGVEGVLQDKVHAHQPPHDAVGDGDGRPRGSPDGLDAPVDELDGVERDAVHPMPVLVAEPRVLRARQEAHRVLVEQRLGVGDGGVLRERRRHVLRVRKRVRVHEVRPHSHLQQQVAVANVRAERVEVGALPEPAQHAGDVGLGRIAQEAKEVLEVGVAQLKLAVPAPQRLPRRLELRRVVDALLAEALAAQALRPVGGTLS